MSSKRLKNSPCDRNRGSMTCYISASITQLILIVCDNGPIKSLNAAQKRIEKTSNLPRISRIPALAHLLLFLRTKCWRRVYSKPKGGEKMLNWSITFLVIGLIAGVLGFSGVAGAATQIAWILFVIFLVLFVASLVMGRGGPPT